MTYLTTGHVGSRRSEWRRLAAVFEAIQAAWSTWRARRDRRDAFAGLLACDDRMLSDIGVLRDEVEWAARLPLHVDAAQALRDRAAGRRAIEERGRRVARRHDGRHLDRVYSAEVLRIGVPR